MEFCHKAEGIEAKTVEEQVLVNFLDPQHCSPEVVLLALAQFLAADLVEFCHQAEAVQAKAVEK